MKFPDVRRSPIAFSRAREENENAEALSEGSRFVRWFMARVREMRGRFDEASRKLGSMLTKPTWYFSGPINDEQHMKLRWASTFAMQNGGVTDERAKGQRVGGGTQRVN